MSSASQILNKLWPRSVRGQLILGIAFVHLLLMTFFVFDLVFRQRKFLKKQNYEQANNFVTDFAANATPYIISNDLDQLERFTLYHTKFPNLRYAMILSADGVVIAHTNTVLVGKRPSDSISQQLNGVSTGKILFEDDHILDIAAPIIANKKVVGWARAGVAQEFIHEGLQETLRDGFIYILMAVLLGTAFAILIGSRLTEKLHKLISIAKAIRAGDRNIRAPEFNTIELSDLSTAFNQMLNEMSANENLLSIVIENMPVGVWVLDDKGTIVSGNSAGRQIWEREDIEKGDQYAIYKGWYSETQKLIDPEQMASARAFKKGETTINEEIEIETFKGNRKTILNSAIALKDKNGAIIGAIVINVDITDRKKITEQLALSESTFRSAFDNSAIGMGMASPDQKFLKVNKEFCRMLGYSEEELLLQEFKNLTHPDDIEENVNYVKQVLAGKINSFQMDKRYFHKNGTIVWARLSSSIVRDSQNNPLFFISQIEDISETKKTIEQLALSESTFRSAFDFSAIGMALVSPAGKILEGNKQLFKMLGYDENDSLPTSFQDITHPDDRQEGLSKQKQAVEGQSDFFQMDKRYIHKNGSIISAHVSISMVRDSQHKPLFAVAQIEDVTERKKTIEQLALSESTFRNAFDYSAIGMTLVSTSGRFLRVNKSLCKMVGYSDEELLSLTFQHITHPDDLEADLAFLHQALEGKIDSYRMEKRYIRKDKTLIWVQLSVSLVRDHNQKPLFFISQIEDISERKKAEQLEKEMNKAVADAQEIERQQISMELHDNVKQIMAGCLLHMDLIKMYVKDEKVSPIVDNVRDYIRDSIEELRRISHQLSPSVDLSIPLEEKIKMVVNTMNVKNAVEVCYDFHIKEQPVKADAQLTLYRIVQEQFANILKHANASRVEIMVKKCDGDITMTITDNGVGFDNRIPKIGIGLENIKRRVQILNGNFDIQTEPGHGCRLSIQLPGVN